VSARDHVAGPAGPVAAVASVMALVAVAVWLGGLVALGAIAAPVVFAIVPWPSNADAMTFVFERFDRVAMSCAAIVLAAEAARAVARVPFGRRDHLRAGASVAAGALAVLEGVLITPHIAALHRAGALRGVGDAGIELARLHDLAEWNGKIQLILLVVVIALHATARATPRVADAPDAPSRAEGKLTQS
jgi:hypothetical protein